MIVKTLVIPAFLASLPIFNGTASQELKQELFENFYKYTLSHVEKTLCINFANEREAKYAFREQYSEKKVTQDIVLGAAAEIATSNLLESELPDFKIYTVANKTYAPDIILANGQAIHVKSTNAITANAYGLSWSFSVSDPLIKNPTDNDYLALWVVDSLTLECILIAYVPAKEVVWGLPHVSRFADSKRCVYASSILPQYLSCNLSHPQHSEVLNGKVS